MDYLSLPIFPQASLAGSLTTTVWVGVLVSCFFNLRFGWVLSGLVVPGYLVPLLILKPWAAVAIFVEATVTFAVVWFYSQVLSRYGLWNSLFGRDRFFALLIVSVIVRIVFDAFLFPVLGEYVTRTFDLKFDYHGNLHSFGLVVVALMANQFWKPGWRSGTVQIAITVALTYLFVSYGLVEWTNFSIADLDHLYYHQARYIWITPKSYIILLVTAYIASRMNLRFGQEYSGILIPALIALQWYEPFTLMITFCETFLILGIATLALRLPIFRDANMEGARKILFFFNISFLYQFVLGHFMGWCFPDHKVTDFYGFGYLLTTFMAITMYDKGIAWKLVGATLQTSLVAVIIASVLGYILIFLPIMFAAGTMSASQSIRKTNGTGCFRIIQAPSSSRTQVSGSGVSYCARFGITRGREAPTIPRAPSPSRKERSKGGTE